MVTSNNLKLAAGLALISKASYLSQAEALKYFKERSYEALPVFVDNHAAFVLFGERHAVVVVRGTEKDFEDILTDLNFKFNTINSDLDHKVHTGFYEGAQALLPKIREIMIDRSWQNKPIYFCGHSLGGAIAQLLAYEADWIFSRKPEAYSFGAPRLCNWQLATSFQQMFIHYRVVNASDIVPNVPFFSMGFEHSEDAVIYITSAGVTKINPSIWFRYMDQFKDVVSGLIDGFRGKIPVRRFTRHRIQEYITRLNGYRG